MSYREKWTCMCKIHWSPVNICREMVSSWSTPQMSTVARLSRAEARSPSLSLELPRRWQALKYLSHLLLLPSIGISRKWDCKPRRWDSKNPHAPIWDAGILSLVLTSTPDASFPGFLKLHVSLMEMLSYL